MVRKILYYESGSGYGGSAVSLYRIIKYLDRGRIKPLVLVNGIGPRIEEMKKMGVNVDKLNIYRPIASMDSVRLYGRCFNLVSSNINFLWSTIRNVLSIARIIKTEHVSAVHLNNGIFENFPALIAAKLCGVPCVSHIRGTEPIRKIERLFGSWASRIITLNSEMNNLYASLFGDDKACIVWNGIDVDSFSNPDRDKLRREYFVIKDHFIVGTVARLIPGKGIPEFIKAAAEVLKARKDITFFIIGDDPLLDRSFENRMKQLANNLNISEQLIFTSWRDDAIDLMSGLDLVVQFSTFTEGMSLTPIEAMALGKPVVTSDVPGYVDTVEDKVTGFILPAGDVPSLARSILHLAGDRQLARDLGERGKERALTCFDARITVKRIEEIYRSIFDNGR